MTSLIMSIFWKLMRKMAKIYFFLKLTLCQLEKRFWRSIFSFWKPRWQTNWIYVLSDSLSLLISVHSRRSNLKSFQLREMISKSFYLEVHDPVWILYRTFIFCCFPFKGWYGHVFWGSYIKISTCLVKNLPILKCLLLPVVKCFHIFTKSWI